MAENETAAVIVAGGRGTRARVGLPKQYALLGGEPLLRRTVEAFLRHPDVGRVQVVIAEENRDFYDKAVQGLDGLMAPVIGGEDRQKSVLAGLDAFREDPPERILIHDGARPFVSHKTICDVLSALHTAEGAIAALPVSDTLKRANPSGGIEETVPRDGLWRAQTPQGFRFHTILAAHRDAESGVATDDASLLEARGIHVSLVPDDPTNIKLTYAEDFDVAERLLAAARETRVGMGYDVHAFGEGDHVTLGGVHIPHSSGLEGHSDADAGLHAITDAILGALGDGDIGQHFPPSDERWRNSDSRDFLAYAGSLMAARGGTITHIDLTLICEAPKIGPHRDAMRTAIAETLGIAEKRVSIKATTTEGLGFAGRREGIAAQAAATLTLPAVP